MDTEPSTSAAESAPLTLSQEVVLNHLLLGKTNGEIAEAVGLSVKTVKAHLTEIYRAAGCRNARQMIARHYNPEGTK